VAFDAASRNRVESTFFGVKVNIISLDDLIANKQASGRDTDMADLKRIQQEAAKKARD
jgi:predicted nucleotidyltransferase